jgi:hypothetical protein
MQLGRAESVSSKPKPPGGSPVVAGGKLFTQACASCLGATGGGGEGPNLHGIGLDKQAIEGMIRRGEPGEMPSFAKRFQQHDLDDLAAYVLSLRVLPARSSSKTRLLFVWHLFDSLTHLLLEASFLYNCFYTFLPVSAKSSYIADTGVEPLRVTPPNVHFLGAADRFYGAAYGSSPTARLWQEYARADRRWGGADLTVISLELLTVLIAGPLSAYIGYLLSCGHGDVEVGGAKRRGFSGKLAFWMVVLATGELYGGFMTFAPEWLSGSPNLDTSNWMYL